MCLKINSYVQCPTWSSIKCSLGPEEGKVGQYALKIFASLTAAVASVAFLGGMPTFVIGGLTLALLIFLNKGKDVELKKEDKFIEKVSKEDPTIANDSSYTNRSRMSRIKLREVLKKENKVFVETKDNGDCFYDAFAVGLNKLHKNGENVTVSELRQLVQTLAQDPNNGWINDTFKYGFGQIDTYENYVKNVGNPNSEIPIWGKESRDGVLLCRHFGVNLNVYEVSFTGTQLSDSFSEDERINYLKNSYLMPENYATGSTPYPKNEKFRSVIDIGLYDGHFLGVAPK